MNNIVIYGVCVLLVILSVAITSLIKIIVVKVAEKNGKTLSGTQKEYILTPLAVSIASLSVYFWLKSGCEITNMTFIKLVSALAGAVAPIIYLLLFQSTRKIGLKIIRWIKEKIDVKKAIKAAADYAAGKEVDAEDFDKILKTGVHIPKTEAAAPMAVGMDAEETPKSKESSEQTEFDKLVTKITKSE